MIRFLSALIVCTSILFEGVATAENVRRPNVLLICVDDLKPALACYGDPIAKTPNIDRLAARGVTFDRAYCNQAVCSPSRNALLVGLRPQTLGIYDLGTNFRKSRPDAVTLPQYFKQHGYRTEALGKLFHVGHGNHEDAASWTVPPWRPAAGMYALDASKPKDDPSASRSEAKSAGARNQQPRGAAIEAADVPDNAYSDGAIADEAINRLNSAAENRERPFFLAVGFIKPHLPFCAPQKYWNLYAGEQFELPRVTEAPRGAPPFAPTTWGELRQYVGMPKSGPVPEAQARELIHGYYAAVSYMDEQVGRLLDALDGSGLRDNTVIVFWGDHGWHLGDHGMWCKHSNYEQAARIPVIVSVPSDNVRGAKTKALVESVDIFPTLCELAGLKAPAGLDGKSFRAVLSGEQAQARPSAIHVYPRNQLIGRAVRTERFRLVEWKKPGDSPTSAILELYDYERDPEETTNIAEERPEIVAQLRAILVEQPEARPQIKAAPTAEASKAATKRGKTDRATLFARKDRDSNGTLTRQEFLKGQPDPDKAPARFGTFDANGDGLLTKEEFIHMGKTLK